MRQGAGTHRPVQREEMRNKDAFRHPRPVYLRQWDRSTKDVRGVEILPRLKLTPELINALENLEWSSPFSSGSDNSRICCHGRQGGFM